MKINLNSPDGNVFQLAGIIINLMEKAGLDSTEFNHNVFEHKDYYAFVEKGRKSGGKFPPLNVIEKWIQDKRIRPENRGGRLPTQKQLAFLIGRKIAEEGIKPGNYEINTIKELNDIYVEKTKDALDIDLEEYQLKVLDEINVMFGKEKSWYYKGKMK